MKKDATVLDGYMKLEILGGILFIFVFQYLDVIAEFVCVIVALSPESNSMQVASS